MEVAAELMSIERIDRRWHGVVLEKPDPTNASVVVDRVATDSPAALGGLEPGDEITMVGELSVERALDLERALLERETGEEVEITVRRDHDSVTLSLILASVPKKSQPNDPINSVAWEVMGLKLRAISSNQVRQRDSKYNGGVTVTAVRPGSPAARQGIQRGDVLVGVHRWETISMENVSYILTVAELPKDESVKFWVLRGRQVLQGNLRLATRPSRDATE
jgi:serine protease Do